MLNAGVPAIIASCKSGRINMDEIASERKSKVPIIEEVQ